MGIGALPLAYIELHLPMSMKVIPQKAMLKITSPFIFLNSISLVLPASSTFNVVSLSVPREIDKTHFSSSSTWKGKRQNMA